MGGVTALLPTLPYETDNFFLATDLARDVVEGDCLGLHLTQADRARLTTGSGDIFLGVAGEVYGGSASITTSQPAGLDAKPWTALWGRNIPTRIETGATVAYRDPLTLSTVTAGAMRTAVAGERIYGYAKQAKTATATDFLARCDILPAGGGGGFVDSAFALNVRIPDVSTAGSVWVVSPYAGTIKTWYTALHNAITVANANLTLELGGTLVTGSGITITQAGSAAGDVDSANPTAANVVTAGQAIEVITDGGSTTAAPADATIIISR